MKYTPILFSLLSYLFSFAQNDSIIQIGIVKQKAGNHNGAIYDFSTYIQKHTDEIQKLITDINSTQNPVAVIDTNLSFPYFLRGKSYLAMKEGDSAMNDFTMAIKINPRMNKAYYERSKLLFAAGKKDEGCANLSIPMQLKYIPSKELFDENFCWKKAVVNATTAFSKLNLKQYQTALDLIQPSILLCPDSARYYLIRAKSYFGLSKLDSALIDFDKTNSLGINNKDIFLSRGLIYYEQKKMQEAFEQFTKAIELDIKFTDAYIYRAYVCESMDKKQSALYDYQQAQKQRPNEANLFLRSGKLKSSMDDINGACIDYRTAANLGDEEAELLLKNCKKIK
ncbi:MAG TPA: hypothetical protein VFL70_06595 [Bacteroidia bacterium]|nr:hypothetical protein [Bacteroidia bacterium]